MRRPVPDRSRGTNEPCGRPRGGRVHDLVARDAANHLPIRRGSRTARVEQEGVFGVPPNCRGFGCQHANLTWCCRTSAVAFPTLTALETRDLPLEGLWSAGSR